MDLLLRHTPPGRQHPPGTPKMSAPFVRSCPFFLLLPAVGNQAAFPKKYRAKCALFARLFKKMNTVLSNQLAFQNARGILARRAPGARGEAPARRVPALRQASGWHIATRIWPLQNASFFLFFQRLKLMCMGRFWDALPVITCMDGESSCSPNWRRAQLTLVIRFAHRVYFLYAPTNVSLYVVQLSQPYVTYGYSEPFYKRHGSG
jgi:hypothetical protein